MVGSSWTGSVPEGSGAQALAAPAAGASGNAASPATAVAASDAAPSSAPTSSVNAAKPGSTSGYFAQSSSMDRCTPSSCVCNSPKTPSRGLSAGAAWATARQRFSRRGAVTRSAATSACSQPGPQESRTRVATDASTALACASGITSPSHGRLCCAAPRQAASLLAAALAATPKTSASARNLAPNTFTSRSALAPCSARRRETSASRAALKRRSSPAWPSCLFWTTRLGLKSSSSSLMVSFLSMGTR
mmetsp:Transcript_1746/g.5366  ORF Transcript_1746/g.5366 Transcript_1746/m.5366 type:complete len:247 (-) Transcript_1746:829-1569(-)